MADQWYFEIGDGQTYGPFTLEKLRKWAAAGNLMPTHRVRPADSNEWTIAAYVPGLELTTADTTPVAAPTEDPDAGRGKLGALLQKIARKSPKGKEGEVQTADIVELCNELMEIAFARNASDIHIDPDVSTMSTQGTRGSGFSANSTAANAFSAEICSMALARAPGDWSAKTVGNSEQMRYLCCIRGAVANWASIFGHYVAIVANELVGYRNT